jgi:hypothetical protein
LAIIRCTSTADCRGEVPDGVDGERGGDEEHERRAGECRRAEQQQQRQAERDGGSAPGRALSRERLAPEPVERLGAGGADEQQPGRSGDVPRRQRHEERGDCED